MVALLLWWWLHTTKILGTNHCPQDFLWKFLDKKFVGNIDCREHLNFISTSLINLILTIWNCCQHLEWIIIWILARIDIIFVDQMVTCRRPTNYSFNVRSCKTFKFNCFKSNPSNFLKIIVLLRLSTQTSGNLPLL